MTVAWAIARRELASLFRVPLGWLALAVFSAVAGWLFLRGILVPGQPATMRPLFSTMGWLLLPLAPAVSMRLVSEELRSGTIEPLLTSPASDYAVIAGKFLGAFLFLGVLVSPTLVFAAVLWSHASPAPDVGPLAAGYLSVALLAGLFLAAGLLVSTLTSNQTLAFLGAMLLTLGLLIAPDLAASSLAGVDAAESPWAAKALPVVRALQVGRRTEDFARGVIDTGHVVAFAAWTGVFLAAAAVSLESRRWRSARPVLRGLRYGSLSLVLLGAVLLSAVLATLLGDRFARRFDVTSTGEHRLSPRSVALAAGLRGPAEVIAAADWLTLDRRVREDVRDVLDLFARQGSITARPIDFSVPSGHADYAALLRDLVRRDGDRLAAARSAVEAGAAASKALRGELATLLPAVEQAAQAVPDASGPVAPAVARVQQACAGAAAAARAAGAAEEQVPTFLSRAVEDILVPDTDQAAAGVQRALDQLARQLLSLEAEVRTLAAAQPRAAGPLRQAADAVRGRREAADAAAEPLRTLPPIDALTVVNATAQSSALIVREASPAGGGGGVGVRAIPLDRVVRPGEKASTAEVRRRVEAEVATGLSVISNQAPPVVVFVSCDPAIASGARPYGEATARLRQAGADVVLWDLLLSQDPPALGKLNPEGRRPVVYIVRMPDQSQPAFGQVAGGIERARQLAGVVLGLSERGSPVLIGVAPAVVPTSKEPEAAGRVLAAFGLLSPSDRPILTPVRAPGGGGVEVNARARPAGDPAGRSPLAAAVADDPVLLPWATPVAAVASPAGLVTADLAVEGGQAWRESRWLELRRPGPEGRAVRAPVFDAAEDERAGSWTVVASGRLPAVGATPARRLVAVGSAEWLDDGLLARRITVDGRTASPASGNLELLDAAVAWLTGQEALALPGPTAGAIAMVSPLSESARGRLGWVLLAGLPLGILALGVVHRVARG